MDVIAKSVLASKLSYEGVNWWVSNPLILLIVGAGLSGLLIPYITRKWQDHQTELDLKVKLVDRLSESITSIVTATRFPVSKEQMNDDIREYHKGCSYVTSRIEAYFYQTNDRLAKEWHDYDIIIQKLYQIPETNAETNEKIAPEKITNRASLIASIKDFIERSQTKKKKSINWEALKSPYEDNQEMTNVIDAIYEIKHDLIREIMNSDIEAFHQGLFKKIGRELMARSARRDEVLPV